LKRGKKIRQAAKSLGWDYRQSASDCRAGGGGRRLAEIFRNCGFDRGDYPKATSTDQQYWVAALGRALPA